MTDWLIHWFDLLEANPQYAHVRFPDGWEDMVSIKHLAPPGNVESSADSVDPFCSVGPARIYRKEVDLKQTEVETQSQDVECTVSVEQ